MFHTDLDEFKASILPNDNIWETVLCDGKAVTYNYKNCYDVKFWDNEDNLDTRGNLYDVRTRKIISCTIKKFFNVGENELSTVEEFENLKRVEPHLVIDKLDGSMVSPFIMDGKVLFKTRKALVANKPNLTDPLIERCRALLERNLCPIFEIIGPNNRIVIKYPEDKLVLIAVRSMETGEYLDFREFREFETVRCFNSIEERFGRPEFFEGAVIFFPRIQRFFKMKTKEYVYQHKWAYGGKSTRSVLESAIMKKKIDDIRPHLDKEDTAVLDKIEEEIDTICAKKMNILIRSFPPGFREMGNLEFKKIIHQKYTSRQVRNLCFMLRAGRKKPHKIMMWKLKIE